MKRTAIALLLSVVYIPAHAALTVDEKLDYCTSMSEIVKMFIESRYEGIPMSQAMATAVKISDAVPGVKDLVKMVYNLPVGRQLLWPVRVNYLGRLTLGNLLL